MRSPEGILLILLLAIHPWMIPQARAQSDHCDPDVPVSGNNPLHYAPRGETSANTDRCEGIFMQQVSGLALQLASLVEHFEDYAPSDDARLVVEWAPQESPLRLQAVGLRHDLHYRMDTTRPSGSSTFSWPTQVLAVHQITRNDLGVVGSARYPLGGEQKDVYVPLRISRSRTAPQSDHYLMKMVSIRQLEEVFLTLARADAEGNPETFIRFEQPLDYGHYPAQQPIGVRIPLADLPASGLYYVEVSALFKGGGSSSTNLLFHHSGTH